MSVTGRRSKAARLLANLDENSLADLAADILRRRGHSQVKITDGPGDGCRDIHSLMPDGQKHLTQSKHHKDAALTVSSKDMGELPLGLVKLGYQCGLFITNARVSPQAKREYLDNYPTLDLEYIEGSEIPRTVFSDVVLHAIWYDGQSLDRVAYTVVVPVIARDLLQDKPLALVSSDDTGLLSGDAVLGVRKWQAQAKLSRAFVSTHSFQSYRPPSLRTWSESWMPSLYAVEMIIYGPSLLEAISDVERELARQVCRRLNTRHGAGKYLAAIRFGTPSLAPLGGTSAGARIELGYDPWTLVLQNSAYYDEWDWLLPDPARSWLPVPPGGARATESDWVRWYNAELDACLNLGILSLPSDIARGQAEMVRALHTKWWARSLFAMLPAELDVSAGTDELTAPSISVPWYDQGTLCGWLDPNFGGYFGPAPLEAECGEDDSMAAAIRADDEALAAALASVSNRVKTLGGSIVDPAQARKMFAVADVDVFPSEQDFWYRPVDLLRAPSIVPSPVAPSSRRLAFEICWLLAGSVDECQPATDIIVACGLDPPAVPFSATGTFEVTNSGVYFFLSLSLVDLPTAERTSEVLRVVERDLSSLVDAVERELVAGHGSATRATKQYWTREVGIFIP